MENDNNNAMLVPVGGPKQKDIIHEMNTDQKNVQRDLELEMENLTFMEEQAAVNKAPDVAPVKDSPKTPPKSNSTGDKSSKSMETPTSPKGQLKTTHFRLKHTRTPVSKQNYGYIECTYLAKSWVS